MSLTAAANSLVAGVFTTTVWFTNQHSLAGLGRLFKLRIGQPDNYTELFDSTTNDLAFQSFTFTPDGSSSFYSACHDVAAALQAASKTQAAANAALGLMEPVSNGVGGDLFAIAHILDRYRRHDRSRPSRSGRIRHRVNIHAAPFE